MVSAEILSPPPQAPGEPRNLLLGPDGEVRPLSEPEFNRMIDVPLNTGMKGLQKPEDGRNPGADRGWWYDELLPAAESTAIVSEAAGEAVVREQVVLDEVAVSLLMGRYHEPSDYQGVPDSPDELAASAEAEERVNKWLLDATLMDVIERFDPEDLIDPDRELLANCADTAIQMSKDYDGLKEFPDSYLRILYTRELMYVNFGLQKMRELISRYEEATGEPVTEFNVLFDFDRSQVALVDPIRKPIGEAEDGTKILPDSESYHLVRPGWGYLVRHMQRELAKHEPSIAFKVGAATDRPQNPHGGIGKTLVETAHEHFSAAGIPDELVDDNLIVSSTDSPLVEKLPKFLRFPMRKLIKRDPDGMPIPMTARQTAQIEGRQRMALVRAGLASRKMVYSERFIYHEKLSIGIALRRFLKPGAVALVLDDLRVIKYLQADNIMGGQIEPSIKPTVPDELGDDFVDLEKAI